QKLPDDVVLLIAGGQHSDDDSDFVDRLKQDAVDMNLGGRVRFMGYLSEVQVAEVMAATDVILAPFIESSGSGSLALSLACGKPIIASPIQPHLEMTSVLPGLFVLPETSDPNGYAGAIIKLRNNPDKMKSQSEKSLEYARTHSYGQMADDTLQVYKS